MVGGGGHDDCGEVTAAQGESCGGVAQGGVRLWQVRRAPRCSESQVATAGVVGVQQAFGLGEADGDGGGYGEPVSCRGQIAVCGGGVDEGDQGVGVTLAAGQAIAFGS